MTAEALTVAIQRLVALLNDGGKSIGIPSNLFPRDPCLQGELSISEPTPRTDHGTVSDR
jgi:hypothetical protein